MILDKEKTRKFKSKKQLNHRDRYRIKKQQKQSAQKLIAMDQKLDSFSDPIKPESVPERRLNKLEKAKISNYYADGSSGRREWQIPCFSNNYRFIFL